jgi:pSer/pThr/pTyr-binding forkhead associated (FHA) protein
MDYDRTSMMGGLAAPNVSSEEGCPACETSIPAGDEFCPRCGYQRGTWQGAGAAAPATGSNGTAPAAGPALWTLSSGSQSWPLAAGRVEIGRGEVEIRIEDGFASRRHAQLEVTADEVRLMDLGSSNGTFVNERKLEANAPEALADGAAFRVANTTLNIARASTDATVVAQETAEPEGTQVMDANTGSAPDTDSEGTAIDPQSQPEPGKEGITASLHAAESMWELRREDGSSIAIALGEVTLGRKADAAHVIEGDSYVSGVHCRLIATTERLEIIDLKSTNGTFVNEARLDAETPWQLADGDKLRIGQTLFTVENNKPTVGQELEETEA